MRTLKSSYDLRGTHGIAQLTVNVLRESPMPGASGPAEFPLADTPAKVDEALRSFLATDPEFDWERETFFVLLLNARRKIIGWQKVSSGTLDTLLVHARDVFRLAIVANAAAIVVAHNHPSGSPIPSEADVKMTRDLIRAGQLLRIELLDHVILANLIGCDGPRYQSLRELGYWF